jgi:hypothetical protein
MVSQSLLFAIEIRTELLLLFFPGRPCDVDSNDLPQGSPPPPSVSHGYGFPRGFQLLVYTGMGTVYQMSELCDTVPVWEVWRCLVVSGIGRTASRLLPFGYVQLVNVYPSPYLPALSVLFRLLDSFLSASML